MASIFACLHGVQTGIMTIARGTVPLALYGSENYGYRLGLLGAPARILQSAAPLGFALLIDRFGAGALAVFLRPQHDRADRSLFGDCSL